MKDLIIKIIFICIALAATILTATHLFLVFQGKAVIISQLESLTKKKVSMDNFAIKPLFKLEITNLKIQDMGKVDFISITPSISGFMGGNLAFNDVEIIKPDLTFHKNSPLVKAELPEQKKSSAPGAISANISVPIDQEKIKRINLIFKRIKIKDGRINFFDHTVGDKGIKLTFKDLNFTMTNLFIMPRSSMTNFELSAKIPWLEGQEEGKIYGEGWINFFKRDMKVTLKVQGIDGVYLYPYYSKWVDLDKAKIEKARLNFESNMTGLDNNLTAECHLELADIVRKERPSEEPMEKAERITNTVMDIFKAMNQGKIVLDFTIRTKMDKLEFGFGDIRMAFEEKILKSAKNRKPGVVNILMLPGQLVAGTIRSATDITKAFIDGTFAIGNEIKEGVKGSFKKQPK